MKSEVGIFPLEIHKRLLHTNDCMKYKIILALNKMNINALKMVSKCDYKRSSEQMNSNPDGGSWQFNNAQHECQSQSCPGA